MGVVTLGLRWGKGRALARREGAAYTPSPFPYPYLTPPPQAQGRPRALPGPAQGPPRQLSRLR